MAQWLLFQFLSFKNTPHTRAHAESDTTLAAVSSEPVGGRHLLIERRGPKTGGDDSDEQRDEQHAADDGPEHAAVALVGDAADVIAVAATTLAFYPGPYLLHAAPNVRAIHLRSQHTAAEAAHEHSPHLQVHSLGVPVFCSPDTAPAATGRAAAVVCNIIHILAGLDLERHVNAPVEQQAR